MIIRAFLRWPWATTLLAGLLLWTVILTAAAGNPGAWPPVWLTALAAMTPAVGVANLVAALLGRGEEVSHA